MYSIAATEKLFSEAEYLEWDTSKSTLHPKKRWLVSILLSVVLFSFVIYEPCWSFLAFQFCHMWTRFILLSFVTCEPGWPVLACWISFQYFHLLTGFILLSFVFCEPGWSFLASWISYQFCYLWTRLVLLRPRPRGVRWEWDTWRD